MNQIIRNSLSSIIMLVLAACNLFGPQPTIIGNTPVQLTVQTQNGATTFSQAGETINYNYLIKNTGAVPIAGPVSVADSPRQVSCPTVNVLGSNESITCTSTYTITQSDVTTGSVINLAIATVGTLTSNQTGVTLTRAQPSSTLKLAKTASSQTYGQAGELITYTYTVTNTGTTQLGPAQFTVSDNKLGAPLNCTNSALAPGQSVSCSAPYNITAADMNLATVTNTATVSGAGQTSAPVTFSIANLAAPATQTPTSATPTPSSNFTPGSTIQHQVAVGEWLIQIVRCYGATYNDVRSANPQISDPDLILPFMTVTVPRIGSSGKIYGPPCVTFYTVQSGDTWTSIAQQYNADVAVLQKANLGVLTAGALIKVPRNSAGYAGGIALTPVTPVGNTPSPTLQQITFEPGNPTAVRIGVVNPGETIRYVLSATQGQMLSIKFTAPVNEVAIGVIGPTGIVLKPQDASPTWSSGITTSGNHIINIAPLTGGSSKLYRLEVTLTPVSYP